MHINPIFACREEREIDLHKRAARHVHHSADLLVQRLTPSQSSEFCQSENDDETIPRKFMKVGQPYARGICACPQMSRGT